MSIAVMLATLTDRRVFGDDWLLERKFDGERCVARKEDDAVRLESRTGKDLTGAYPEVRAAVGAQRTDGLLLDGELVAFDGRQTSFSRLQQRLGITPLRLRRRWSRRSRSSTACLTSWKQAGRISPGDRWSSAAPSSSGQSGRRRICRSAKAGTTSRSVGMPRRAEPAGRG